MEKVNANPISPSVLSTMLCPVSKQPFKDAQILGCCGESVDFDTIKRIFDTAQINKATPACPCCEKEIKAYAPNPTLQKLVNELVESKLVPKQKNLNYPLSRTHVTGSFSEKKSKSIFDLHSNQAH